MNKLKLAIALSALILVPINSFALKKPAFDSKVIAKDSGIVKPIDIKSKKPIRIAVLGLEVHPFWYPVRDGVYAASKELEPLNGKADWIVPFGESHTSDYFSKAIETAIEKGYDGIATIAGNENIIPAIKKAVAAGIPVATFNSETNKTNPRLFYVGADSYVQGQKAGEYMVKILKRKGKIGILTGFFDVEAHQQRVDGFKDYIKKHAPKIEIVAEYETRDQNDKGYILAEKIMKDHPDIDAFYMTAGGQLGAVPAIENAGEAGKIKIITYDFLDEIMEYVKKGVVTATIGQGPFAQGRDPVIRLYNYIVGGVMPPAGQVLTKVEFVTKDNIDKYWKK